MTTAMIWPLWSHVYDQVLGPSLLDARAPSRQRSITVRPKAPWYTSEIASQKRLRRKFEHQWRRTKSQTHRRDYQKQCCVVNDLYKHTIVGRSRAIRIIRNFCFQLSTSCFRWILIAYILAAPMRVPRQIPFLISLLRRFQKVAFPFRVPSLTWVLHPFLLLRAQFVSLPSAKWIAVYFMNC